MGDDKLWVGDEEFGVDFDVDVGLGVEDEAPVVLLCDVNSKIPTAAARMSTTTTARIAMTPSFLCVFS